MCKQVDPVVVTIRRAGGAEPESGADIRVQSDVFASGDEKILFERLYEQSPDLGYMFYSALFVLRRNAPGQSSNPSDPPGGVNPDRMAHSAHSVRETLVHAEKKLKLDLFAYSAYGKATPTSADKTENKFLNNPTHVEKIQSISDPGRYLPKHLSRLYKDINKLNMWFVGVAHHGPPPPEQEYCKKLGAFTRHMNRLLEPYFQVTRQIDAALKDQGEDLEKMESLLCKNWQAYNYFFKNAPARWLDALIRRGTYFVHVPGSVSDTGEYMPIVWPESRYLARIANERPELVTDTILKVRVTERKNPTVLADFAQAASEMPAEFGKKIAGKALEEQWHRNAGQRLPWIVAEQIGALAAKLAPKEFGTALKLCENLLHLNDDGYARGYLNDYDYRCVLEKTVPVLAELDANKTLDMLCDGLSRAVRTVNAGLGSGHMPSSSWHWDVGCDERNMHMGAISLLIVAIRKVLEMSERRIDDLAGSLEVLDSYKDPVFLRIKMHFYAKHPARFAKEMRPLASSQFDVKECESEYRRMLQFGYPYFDGDTRKDLRAKILAGPRPDTGDPAGHERRKDSWTLEKLHPLRNVEEFNPEYTSLKIKLGGGPSTSANTRPRMPHQNRPWIRACRPKR